MSVVLDNFGRAFVFDRLTGETQTYSVPTAIENVANGKGRFVHGQTGTRIEGGAQAAAAEEPAIPLREEGVLDLPAEEAAAAPEPGAWVQPAREAPRPRQASRAAKKK